VLFETKEYKVEAEKKEGCRLEVKVIATKECVQHIHKKAIKNINKEISIPGFRKGKIPDEFVMKKFGHQVEQEWKDLLLNDAINTAFRLTQIYPLTKKSLNKPKIETCTLEEGAIFLFSYEYYPLVGNIDFSSLNLPHIPTPAVTDEELNDVLEEIRESRAEWNEVKDRPITPGDYVNLSINAIEGELSKPISTNRRFQVTPKRMGSWMRALLIGKNVGEEVEGESEPDENTSEEIKAKFQKTKVSITIHAIYSPHLPELNDELAVKMNLPSLDALKEQIKKDLIAESKENINKQRFEDLKNALIEQYPFDLPFSLKHEEIKERMKTKIQELKKQNLSNEEIGLKEKEIEVEVVALAERGLRLHFLIRQIADQGNISVSRDDMNAVLEKQLMTRNKELPKELLDRISNSIFQEKIKEYALSQLPA